MLAQCCTCDVGFDNSKWSLGSLRALLHQYRGAGRGCSATEIIVKG